jgi:carboxypeptidase C (cathepsin A)
MSQTKTCTKCNSAKLIDAFHSKKRGKFGVSSVCKVCQSAYSRARYSENRDLILEKNAEWRRANRAVCAEYTRKHRNRNPESTRESTRILTAAWRARNPERASELAKEYRQRHPEKMSALWRRRQKYVKQATPSWANQFFIAEAYHIAKVRERMLGGIWHVDHIIPLRGKNVCGLHVENNLQVIRDKVNLRKGNNFFERYAT